MSDQDQLGFFSLNQCSNMINTILNYIRLFRFIFSTLGLNFCYVFQPVFFFDFGFRAIFVKKFQSTGCGGFVKCLGELMNCRWNLKTLIKNPFLSLKTNVFGPFNEAG